MVVARGWREGRMGTSFKRYRVSVYKMRRVIWIDDGDDCKTMRMYLIPPNCTF